MMQEGGVILDIVLYVGICFVFGVFDLEIYFWCVVGCYSSTSRKSISPGSQPLIDHETWPELAFTVSSFSLEIEKEEVEVNTSSLAVCRKVQRVNIVNPGM